MHSSLSNNTLSIAMSGAVLPATVHIKPAYDGKSAPAADTMAATNSSKMSGVNMTYMNIFSRTSGFRMTSHALQRAQQRCIPPLIIHWLCVYGSRRRSNDGCLLCHFDKQSIRLIAADVGKVVIRRLSGLFNAYLVIAGNQIITVGHRYKAIKKS